MELPLLKTKEKMHADPVDMASIVNTQYESVFTKEEEDEDTQVIQGNSYPEVTNIMISQEGVLRHLKQARIA